LLFLQGVLYPACHNLISRWAPPDEKGKFVSALLGNVFGTVITWPMCGILIETVGWVYAFYVPAAITILVALVWFLFVSDSPAVHKGITRKEMEYIENSLGNNISKKKVGIRKSRSCYLLY
jgi:MFS transporter, ACS family, solute carrier family 17 (sodium-dependent inorganic phosphate cotransporter), other